MSPRPSNKEAIIAATTKVVKLRGAGGATIREIAAEAGVTEGAIYRHFPSKEALYLEIYSRYVMEMIEAKERIAASGDSIRDRLRAWIEFTYDNYDRFPDAFTYVLLTEHYFPQDQRGITHRQGRIFENMIAKELRKKTIRRMAPALAVGLFSGAMLNVPRMINEGALPGPAVQYVDEVCGAIYRLFDIDNEPAK